MQSKLQTRKMALGVVAFLAAVLLLMGFGWNQSASAAENGISPAATIVDNPVVGDMDDEAEDADDDAIDDDGDNDGDMEDEGDEVVVLKPGWNQIEDEWFYADDDGIALTGWLELTSGTYYLVPPTGARAQDEFFEVDGDTYYFNADGLMQANKWIDQDGDWYYVGRDGVMATSWVEYRNAWYYLDSEGIMQTGWLYNGGKWYYLKASGAMVANDWVKDNNAWYYLNGSGVMQTGWIKLSGTWYYLNGSGVMQTGWLKQGNTWYYLLANGAMVTGSRTIDGKAYYFTSSGAMTTSDGILGSYYNLSSSTRYLIVVNTKADKVGVYTGSKGNWTNVKTFSCTAGASSTPTVKGLFTVQSRGLSFGTSSYTCWYWTQFYGNYLFHSVLYYPGSKTKIKDGRLGINASHGCVRLAIENAKWIYDNIPSGTTVYVY